MPVKRKQTPPTGETPIVEGATHLIKERTGKAVGTKCGLIVDAWHFGAVKVTMWASDVTCSGCRA